MTAITAATRRPTLRTLRALIRNPMDAWPPEVATAPLVRSRLLGQDTVFVCEPSLIGAVLNGQADAFGRAESMRRALRPALGCGLLTADGAHWRWQRRAAAPVFRHERLLGFVPAMLRAAEATRARWQALPPGSAVEMGHEMMRTTFDIIVTTMLSGGGSSIDPARVERGMGEYLGSTGWRIALAMLGAPQWMPFPGQRRAARASAYLRDAMTALVRARRAGAAGGEAEGEDLVGLLLRAVDPDTGQAMGDGEIADNLLTFIVAGHETTAQALGWAMWLLAGHPAAEAAVLAEVAAVTGGAPLEAGQLGRLHYTRQVIEETMRLYPPAAIIVRRALRDVVLDGHAVSAGTAVYVPVQAVHRRVSLWPDPGAFDPGRFAPGRAADRPRYAYLPFGAGPRTCIGAGFAVMEAVAVLATLLPHVRVEKPLNGMEPRPVLRITLRPSDGLPMIVSARETKCAAEAG